MHAESVILFYETDNQVNTWLENVREKLYSAGQLIMFHIRTSNHFRTRHLGVIL